MAPGTSTSSCASYAYVPRKATVSRTVLGGETGFKIASSFLATSAVSSLNIKSEVSAALSTTLTLEVLSGGWCVGSYVGIWANKRRVPTVGTAPGFYVTYYDQDTLELVWTRSYNTHASAAASDTLAKDLTLIPRGGIVAMGVRDAATKQLKEPAIRAIESFGSRFVRQLKHRESFALIGRKGMAPGQAEESHGTADATDATATPGCTYAAVRTDRISMTFAPNGLREAIFQDIAVGAPERDLEVLYDAAVQNPGDSTLYDLSGNGLDITLGGADSPPINPGLGGYLDFSGSKYFNVAIPNMNNVSSYSVCWAGVHANGEQHSGISRGL